MTTTYGGPDGAAVAGGLIALFIWLVFALVMTAVFVLPYFFIFKKAGWHWAMGFLMLLPLVNLVMLYVLAFARWPIENHTSSAGGGTASPAAGPAPQPPGPAPGQP